MRTHNFPLIPIGSESDGFINAHSGRVIDLNRPKKEMIDISDVALVLSRLCRFGGHSLSFYSVAQHSVLVAALATEDLKKEALLHDAAETYLGDVIKPLKILLGETYAGLENKFQKAIADRFGLRNDPATKKRIKEFDKKAIELEHEALIAVEPGRFIATLREHKLELEERWAWPPDLAEKQFMAAYNRYFNLRPYTL